MENTFDAIIVGAGSAGCVLANRLSRDPSCRVLLLEAGGWDWNPLISIPLGARKMTQWDLYNWGDVSEPDPELNGRRNVVLHGKVIGGTSSLNYMAHTRGHPQDYERWAAAGATGWAYDDVLPFFKACETWEEGASQWRGGAGELGARRAPIRDPLHAAFLKAAKAQGLSATEDFNGAQPEGVGPLQFTVKNGRRASAAAVFLRPALRRPNLTVRTGALATKVLFDGRRAIGVEYLHRGRRETALAGTRVVLSLGAINTPQLLMLSGIGPAEHLRSLGIPTIVDLPVGSNLQDHLGFGLAWTRTKPGEFQRQLRFDRVARNMIQAFLFGTGPASSPPGTLSAFLKTRPDLAQPDLEILMTLVPGNADYWFPGVKPAYEDGYAIRTYLLSQKSTGEVRLRSADPTARPRITYNSLTHPDDLAVMRESYKRMWALGNAPELAELRKGPVVPPRELTTDAEIDAFIRAEASHQWHPGCTCPMGEGDSAVLTPDLAVRGVDGLNVADASVMPHLVSGNPNVVVIMLAAKAAHMWGASA